MGVENQHFIISHAQNREDIILSGFFKNIKDGFYVDIGANDPNLDSVTKYFYELGWNGVNVEPIPRLYRKLVNARPRDINLNIGIAGNKGTLRFREYEELHGLSTFSEESFKDYDKLADTDERYRNFKEYKVEVKPLSQVFAGQKVPQINFMKVDVEGFEYAVLDSNDWKKYRPQVLCIEANHVYNDWRPILQENNYSLFFFDGLNEYYVADEAKSVKDSFSYIQTMLPTPIIDYRGVGIIEHYRSEKLRIDAINTDLNNQVFNLQHHLYVAEQSLQELSRFRGLAKGMAKKINLIIEEIILPSKYRGVTMPKTVVGKELRTVENGSAEDIYQSIREYDKSLKGLNPNAHRVRYGILKAHRKYTLKGAKKSAKTIKKGLRKVKNIARGK